MRQACCAEISLSALHHNARVVRKKTPHAKIAAVVKADAYGHGVKTVVAALERHVDLFAVAYLEEALELRLSCQHPILVLEGFFDQQELEAAAKQNIACVVHSAYQLALLESFPCTENMDLWLKVDTGMNRLGFSLGEFQKVYATLNANIKQRSLTLMSHLSSADELESDVSARQISVFNKLVGGKNKAVSLSNSAGIMAWPSANTEQYQQWVRPGIMLYGCTPFDNSSGAEDGLQAAMTLRSTIIGLREIDAGESVGYGATWQAERPSRIGVVAIGYGDGYPRHAKTGTPVLVNGQRVPLVGRVSMDMITVDLTDVEGVEIGDAAILWGQGLPAEEVARHAGTISYELLTGITARVVRRVAE